MRKILDDILSIKKIAGLNVYLINNGNPIISLCVLERKKGEVFIDCAQKDIYNISDLENELPKGMPIALSFSGSGILNKDFQLSEREINIQKFFPENKHDEFYCFEKQFHQHVGLSLCRKSVVQPILDKLEELGFPLLGISIGPYELATIWEMNLTEYPEIPLPGGMLKLEKISNSFTYLNGAEIQEEHFNIAGEKIEVKLLEAYLSALFYLLKADAGSFVGITPNTGQEDYILKKIISGSKFYLLGAVMLVLLINFAFYEKNRKKESSVTQQLAMNKDLLQQRDSLRAVLQAKHDFVEYLGKNKTFYSQMLDEIASTVPNGIKLNTLLINPQQGKAQKKDPLVFTSKIEIAGLSNNTLTLNLWENELSEIEWVREVEVIHFVQEQNSDRGEFLIEIQLKHD